MVSPYPPEIDGLILGGAYWRRDELVRSQGRHPEPYLEAVRVLLEGFNAKTRVDSDGRLRARGDVIEAARTRWEGEQRVIPFDLQLGPEVLLWWYLSAGSTTRGYYVTFAMRRWAEVDVEFLAGRLVRAYGWVPVLIDDRGPLLRLVRSGDRLGLRRLLAGRLPGWAKLGVRSSAPVSAEVAARRRQWKVLDETAVAAIREGAATHSTRELAARYGVSPQQIRKIVRGVQRRRGFTAP